VRVADFDYDLPAESIAQQAAPRGRSRLYHLDAAPAERHRSVAELPEILRPGDLLVVNDTRVIPARLFATRPPGGGRVELLLVEQASATEWDCLVRPGRKARPGTRLELPGEIVVEVLSRAEDGRHRVRFSEPIDPHLERLGHVPLPPYIDRPDTAEDRERYQTLWARVPGAIAAPTAGLHFSDELLERLDARGIERVVVTLHVGIGTFKPITAELVHEHQMERERYAIGGGTASAIREARAAGRRVVAVGTTVVRTLESAIVAGGGEIEPGGGETSLFITPGFRFRAVDLLLTNFHLPRSSLLLLVSAFAGRERILTAYRDAIAAGYRFYSYGDAMLLERRMA